MTADVYTKFVPGQDPRLGRQVVHDPRSRRFARRITIDKSTWHDKAIRIYDPSPNPNQPVGCCTGVDKCVSFNAIGNRRHGTVLTMDDALKVYSLATTLDPWDGQYPPDDTGSSGLAAAKAAQQLGWGGEYRWHFGGADEIVQSLMGTPDEMPTTVSVGSWWHYDMFQRDSDGRVHVGGGLAGGHEYTIRGYDADRDWLLGRCWWGDFRDFWIARADLDALLADDGDALVQDRA